MDIEKIAPILEQIIKDNLEKKIYPFGFPQKGIGDKVASGKLRDSIEVIPYYKNGLGRLLIAAEYYAAYVISGRKKGSHVPIKPLMEWIKDRGLQGRDKKGRYITRKSFAFAISNSIKNNGIRSADFRYLSIEDILKDKRIPKLLEDSAYSDLIKAIDSL